MWHKTILFLIYIWAFFFLNEIVSTIKQDKYLRKEIFGDYFQTILQQSEVATLSNCGAICSATQNHCEGFFLENNVCHLLKMVWPLPFDISGSANITIFALEYVLDIINSEKNFKIPHFLMIRKDGTLFDISSDEALSNSISTYYPNSNNQVDGKKSVCMVTKEKVLFCCNYGTGKMFSWDFNDQPFQEIFNMSCRIKVVPIFASKTDLIFLSGGRECYEKNSEIPEACDKVDVFDGKKWTNKASISKPTVAGRATFLPEEVESKNILYLGGGGNGYLSEQIDTIWEIDLDKNIYMELKSVPIPLSQQACCTGIKEFGMVGLRLEGNERGIMIVGGQYKAYLLQGQLPIPDQDITNKVSLLNLDQNFWTTLEPFPYYLVGPTLINVNGDIYSFGGSKSLCRKKNEFDWVSDIYKLSPPYVGQNWIKIGNLPETGCNPNINLYFI